MVGLVLAVAAGVLVASLTVSTNAAVVNGTAIAQATLNSDLSTISHSPGYQCVLLAGAGVSVSGAGVGSGTSLVSTKDIPISIPDPATYSSEFTAYWLDQLVNQTLLDQYLQRHGLAVDSYVLARARANLAVQIDQSIGALESDESSGAKVPSDCLTTTQDLYRTLPSGFVDRLVAHLGAQYVATLHLAGKALTPATVAAYYRAHRADFDNVCLAVLPVANQTEAQQVASAVASGNSFETLAQENGGQVGCAPPALSSVAQVAAQLPIGELSSPIPNGSSEYLLVERVSSATQPLVKVQNDVVEAMVVAATPTSGSPVASLQRNSHVWVDPRYGHWVAAPAFSVETWDGPAQNTVLCPKANSVVDPAIGPPSYHCPPTPAMGAATVSTPGSAPTNSGARRR